VDSWRRLGGAFGDPPDLQKIQRKQITALLDSYQGVAELWWALSIITNNETEATVARTRAIELEPSFSNEAEARRAWNRIHDVFLRRISVAMVAERGDDVLVLDLVSRIATKLGDLLGGFIDRAFGITVELVPCGAARGSFILDIIAQGLPPYALEALDEALRTAPERVDAGVLRQLLALLQQNGVRLTVSLASGESSKGAPPTQLMIDARRRKTMLKSAEDAALRTIDSRDIPQANDLDRVFQVVEMVSNHEALDPDRLGITPRQVSYYRRAAMILGFLSESDELTPAGKQMARLSAAERLRVTVVHFESCVCGNAWIQWSGKKTLREVQPESATEFLRRCVPGLSDYTAARRAQTLIAWYRALADYHYSTA
jgi:hypothetical protein